MRPDPASEDVVAVDEQVMRCQRCGDPVAPAFHIRHTVRRGDMFHHHTKLRKAAAKRVKNTFDEHRLAIENIDLGVGDLTMDAERHTGLGHGFQYRHHLVDVTNAGGRVCGRPGRIELYRGDHAALCRCHQIVRIGAFCQVEGHHRGEIGALWDRRQDPLAIGGGIGTGDNRRDQVRHDQRPPEMRGRIRRHGRQHPAVAKMKMPVIGACQGDGVGHRGAIRVREQGLR